MSETPHTPRQQAPASDNGGISLPTPSTKTVVILAVVALALFVFWRRVRSTGDDGEDLPTDPEEWEADLDDLDDNDEAIEVPVDPDSELDKDAAVIDGLKEAGKLEVDG